MEFTVIFSLSGIERGSPWIHILRLKLAEGGIMRRARREMFLIKLLSDLVSRYPNWHTEDHCKIKWEGQPRNIWPVADIVISMPGRQFIVEYDEDTDPGRNLVKYWPVIHESNQASLTIIEIWRKGPTIGRGYATLSKWMGTRLMKLYPGTIYEFIERTDEPAEYITYKIAQIILGRKPV